MQKVESQWHPIAYASRSMIESEPITHKLRKRDLPLHGPVKNLLPIFKEKQLPSKPIISH